MRQIFKLTEQTFIGILRGTDLKHAWTQVIITYVMFKECIRIQYSIRYIIIFV